MAVPVAGTLIDGTYRVIGPLGQGGMGSVVLALDERLQREVAIKLIHPAYGAASDARERFLAEARAMARVKHENVVEIYAFGELDDVPYFVMEYVPGTSIANWLDDLILANRLPSVDESLGYLDQVCRGLTAIHAAGTVHGDLKPNNVLLGPASRVAIADLGLSRLFDTQSGAGDLPLAGTPAYMPPEQMMPDVPAALLPRADVYALGVLAYEMLTGDLPYDIEDVQDMLRVHARRKAPRLPSDVRPRLNRVFDDVLLGALRFDVNERTATADDVRRQLLRARESMQARVDDLRILVADDDGDFLDLAREALDYAFPGADIETVSDGEQALAAIDRTPANLAVIDLDMPRMNGVELTMALRASHDLAIIVCTAAGGAPDWKLLQSLGAEGFLVKPIDPYALVTLARKALDARRARTSTS
jgi:serine/threonine-protein kinase